VTAPSTIRGEEKAISSPVLSTGLSIVTPPVPSAMIAPELSTGLSIVTPPGP